jgi:hypothetical protein
VWIQVIGPLEMDQVQINISTARADPAGSGMKPLLGNVNRTELREGSQNIGTKLRSRS